VTGLSGDAARLHTTLYVDGDRVTLTLTGELDLFSGPPLAQLLDTAMDGNVKHMDVQMALVDFVDVDGVRVLMNAYRLGASRGVKLKLHDPQPDIVWLLHITGAAVLLGGVTAPAGTDPPYPLVAPSRISGGEPVREAPSVPPADPADERELRADERDRRADDRDLRADDRDRLAQERDRLVDERQRRVSEHQRWEDIREDVADARERNLERREEEG